MAFRPSAFSGVANPEKADYSAAVSSSVSSWAPHGVVAAFCCCTKSNAQTPAWGRTLRAPPEGDDDALAVLFDPVHNLARCRGRDQPASAPQHQLRQRISDTTYGGPGERQRAALGRCRGRRRVKFRPTMTCRPSAFSGVAKSRERGLFGGSLFPGFVLGAARRSCRALLLHKVKCSNSGLGAYAESTSGRRSS